MTGTLFLSSCSTPDPVEETSEVAHNSLTGATADEGYDEAAGERRVAAFVVENTPDARPQWGMDDENYSPDIVLQGEVEGGITRMLWMYADYDKLPEVIGPTRSARPPYIKFSELFDSIFIHWGMSHSKGDYVGATTVFKKDKVDHINQMTLDDQEGMYGRDTTRAVNVEHRGIIYGDKVPATIENEGIRTTPNEYTKITFNSTTAPMSDEGATQIGITYSARTDANGASTHWVYNEEDGMYHTSDFENDFARENLLVLYDDTEYITKGDYQGAGGSVTYCDYKLNGGKAQLFSKGTVKEIEWAVEDNKLILKDTSIDAATAQAANDEAFQTAKENKEETYTKPYIIAGLDTEEGEEITEEDLADAYVVQTVNKGKSWIGWISRNNGGSVSYSGTAPAVEGASDEAAEGEATDAE
jgi:hypothetical protein